MEQKAGPSTPDEWHTDDAMVARGKGRGMAIFCIKDDGSPAHVEFKRSSRTFTLSIEYSAGQGYLVLGDWFAPGLHRFRCEAGRIVVRVGFCFASSLVPPPAKTARKVVPVKASRPPARSTSAISTRGSKRLKGTVA